VLPDPADIGLISQVIRSHRAELGLSQADLADKMCRFYRPTVTNNEVARWERGERIPRPHARRAFEELFGLPVGILDIAAGNERAARKPAAACRTLLLWSAKMASWIPDLQHPLRRSSTSFPSR
jgi:transcriptional regulator with XRE-family HTH domain